MSGDHPMSPEETSELLKMLAVREKEGRSWKTHAIAGAVNLSSGLITWLGFKRTVWDGIGEFCPQYRGDGGPDLDTAHQGN
ncbi:MAG: hypothetical protein MZV63_50095 [Marinilabiliales bacterium]|nr:hypothetical protein [Marinilabiliales bacterium]